MSALSQKAVLIGGWSLLAAAVASGCAATPRPTETAAVERTTAHAPVAASSPINAPFPMPALDPPRFPDRSLDVRTFGAVEGGQVKNTEAFRKAVEAVAGAGGGTVAIPPGKWLTGPIHLKSGVNLNVAEGAELLFSTVFADYLPPVFTRWEGTECHNYSPLIYCNGCTNVAITGGGKLNGQGEAWWPWKKKQKAAAQKLYELGWKGVPVGERIFGTEEAALRPSFIQVVNSKNVLIEGVTISDGPMWTIHPVYSENVIIRRVKVLTRGPNGDGCNPDSSRNVLIEDSFFSTGDDCVVIKAGLNEDGWRVGKPSENIVVRNIVGERGHGGVVIGSEMSGGVRNVFVEKSSFRGTDRGLRIKSMRGRGGVVENVWYQDVEHKDIRQELVHITTFYKSSTVQPRTEKPPTVRGIHIRNIKGQGAMRAIDITGLPEMPIRDVTIENVTIASTRGVTCVDCEGFLFKAVNITPASGPAFSLENSRKITVQGTSCAATDGACVQLEGEKTSEIRLEAMDATRAKEAVALGKDVRTDAVIGQQGLPSPSQPAQQQ
jgi:polygalacturonase